MAPIPDSVGAASKDDLFRGPGWCKPLRECTLLCQSAAALRQTFQIALETTVPHGSNHARNVVGVACHGASADLRMHGVHWRQHMRS